MIVRVLEFAGFLLITAFVVTQVIIPSITDMKMFWLFRKSAIKDLQNEKILETERKINEQINKIKE